MVTDDVTDEHAEVVCRIGQGAECCRYLTLGPAGWSCEKFTALGIFLSVRTDMLAQGDNCEGRANR